MDLYINIITKHITIFFMIFMEHENVSPYFELSFQHSFFNSTSILWHIIGKVKLQEKKHLEQVSTTPLAKICQ